MQGEHKNRERALGSPGVLLAFTAHQNEGQWSRAMWLSKNLLQAMDAVLKFLVVVLEKVKRDRLKTILMIYFVKFKLSKKC